MRNLAQGSRRPPQQELEINVERVEVNLVPAEVEDDQHVLVPDVLHYANDMVNDTDHEEMVRNHQHNRSQIEIEHDVVMREKLEKLSGKIRAGPGIVAKSGLWWKALGAKHTQTWLTSPAPTSFLIDHVVLDQE